MPLGVRSTFSLESVARMRSSSSLGSVPRSTFVPGSIGASDHGKNLLLHRRLEVVPLPPARAYNKLWIYVTQLFAQLADHHVHHFGFRDFAAVHPRRARGAPLLNDVVQLVFVSALAPQDHHHEAHFKVRKVERAAALELDVFAVGAARDAGKTVTPLRSGRPVCFRHLTDMT